MMTPIHRLVRRARARLEAVRVLKGGARGLLLGGGAGLLALLFMKAAPAVAVAPVFAWGLAALGLLAGAVASLFGRRIGLDAAALYLDDRLGTQQRIATLVTRTDGPFLGRVRRELEPARPLPRMPFPREAALVPAALFLLFAAGLLPAAGAEARPAPATVASAPGGAAARPPLPDVAAAVDRLAAGAAPSAAELADLREVIARRIHRPEDRQEMLLALEDAAGGDGEAAKEVAEALSAAEGGGGRREAGGPSAAPAAADANRGGATVTAYPEARELLLAYRRALAEGRSK